MWMFVKGFVIVMAIVNTETGEGKLQRPDDLAKPYAEYHECSIEADSLTKEWLGTHVVKGEMHTYLCMDTKKARELKP